MRVRLSAQPALLLAVLALAGCRTLPVPPAAAPPPPAAQASGPTPAQRADLAWAAAEELALRGFDAQAVAEYEKMRAQAPDRPRLAWRLAVLHDRLGHAEQAKAEYRRALEAEPKNADLLNDLGYCCLRQGAAAEAEKWLLQALTADPGHARASVNLGEALTRLGRLQEALSCFARTMSPAQAYCNVGLLLAGAGQVNRARPFLREALRREPKLAEAREALARLGRPVEQRHTAGATKLY